MRDDPAWHRLGPRIEMRVRGEAPHLEIGIRGDLDLAAAEALSRTLTEAIDAEDSVTVTVDLAALEFIDSSGLRALLTLAHQASARAVTLRLAAPSRPVRRTIEIAGLTEALGLDAPG